MAIMDLFTSLQTIINERSAKKVRQSIHDGIFRANQEVDANKNLVDQVAIRQDAVEDFNTQVIQEMTDKDVISAPELIESRDGEVKLSARLARDKNELTSELAKTKNRTQITPDDFEGTDIEKMQQVFEYAITNKIVKVTLTRSYDLTGGSIFFPQGVNFPFALMIFEGGEIVKNDEGYVFTSLDTNNSRTAPSFVNTRFSTTSDNCYLYDGNKCIRQSVDSCDFKKMGLVETDSYIQSLRVINCETSLLGCDFIKATMAYDFEMAFHKGESSTGGNYSLINIVTKQVNAISFLSLRITDCLMEGFVNNAPIILGTGYGLKINGFYGEANNPSIKFIKGVGVDRLAGQISNSIFNGGLSDDGDVVFEGVTNFNYLFFNHITSNVPPTKTFTSSTSPTMKHENINLYSGGKFSKGGSVTKKYTSYNVQQIDKLTDGIEFEVKLNLKNGVTLSTQLNKQFLFNAKFIYGSTSHFSAHLTGIVSIDGYYKDDSTIFGLNVDVLSERNTSGNVNGNTTNAPVFDYYFKETGTKEVTSTASELTVVFKFIKGKYNASANFNSLMFKPLNDIIAEGLLDN